MRHKKLQKVKSFEKLKNERWEDKNDGKKLKTTRMIYKNRCLF